MLFDAAVSLACQRTALERDLLSSLLAAPSRMMPIADSMGVHQHLFTHEDLRLIYLAVDVGRDHSIETILRVAMAALRQAGYWQDSGPLTSGCHWTPEMLATFAVSRPMLDAATRLYANRLLAIDRRLNQSQASLQRAVGLLMGDVGTEPVDVRPRPVIALAPRRRRGAA